MKLIDTLLLSGGVALIIIVIDQTMKGYFLQSYPLLMLVAICILALNYRRRFVNKPEKKIIKNKKKQPPKK